MKTRQLLRPIQLTTREQRKRLCGYPRPGGGYCTQPVVGRAPDCGRHGTRGHTNALVRGKVIPSSDGCRMVQKKPGVWICKTHGPGKDDTWDVAASLGAQRPCRVPLSARELLGLARSEELDPRTAALLAADTRNAVQQALLQNPLCPPAIRERLSRVWPRYVTPS